MESCDNADYSDDQCLDSRHQSRDPSSRYASRRLTQPEGDRLTSLWIRKRGVVPEGFRPWDREPAAPMTMPMWTEGYQRGWRHHV